MFGMIIVDSMGDYDYVIWPLDESIWNGLSTADCIFPSFLFMMGLAIPLAIKRETIREKSTWIKIFKRASIMFAIGLLLNIELRIPELFTDYSGFRIPGVLQRISICYMVISINYLVFSHFLYHLIFIASCLIIYLGFYYGFDVPNFRGVDCGRGDVSSECNFGAFLDYKIFGPMYMMWDTDPEGLMSTLPAFVNTFSGMCYTLIMRRNTQQKGSKLNLLKLWFGFACILGALGGLAAIGDVVNKKRWSVSFAFITSSMTGMALCLCFILVDILDKRFIKEYLIRPFLWFGMNPLFIYTGMMLLD